MGWWWDDGEVTGGIWIGWRRRGGDDGGICWRVLCGVGEMSRRFDGIRR